MTAILLGFAGLDELVSDAELDPPDGEAGKAAEGRGRGKGMAVIGADPLGESVVAEEEVEASAGLEGVETLEGTALEEESGVSILDGEGVAEGAVAGPEFALEIGGPGGIGGVHGG